MSIYNSIDSTDHAIVVSCQPDQYEHNVVCLDEQDYTTIKHLAIEMGWELESNKD